EHVMAALITEEIYGILRQKLNQLITQFESRYLNILPHFDGSITEFAPTKALVEAIFHYEQVF
ncbi:MAG: hypothetical protein HWN66_21875, partial [Candidatus Helarchaeota archaeon]|nr:hypothetical protein [Candidatus Helarchaeota archaeon]